MRRGAVAGVVVAAVGVLVVGGITAWLVSRPPSPEDGAMRYLNALAAGDIGTIVDMHGVAADERSQTILAAAFSGATEYVSAPRIERISTGRDRPTSVTASVALGESRRTVGFVMELSDGGWRLTGDYLASLSVTTSLGDSVWIGDALVPVGTDRIALLPAVYPIEAAPRHVLTGSATAVVTNETPVDIAVTASVSPDATGSAQQQLDAYENTCTATATAVPEHCGLRVPFAADLGSVTAITWRIDQRPTLALSADARSFAATGGVVVATATGTTPAGVPASFTYRADDWALRGSVVLSGDTMTLAVD